MLVSVDRMERKVNARTPTSPALLLIKKSCPMTDATRRTNNKRPSTGAGVNSQMICSAVRLCSDTTNFRDKGPSRTGMVFFWSARSEGSSGSAVPIAQASCVGRTTNKISHGNESNLPEKAVYPMIGRTMPTPIIWSSSPPPLY